MGTRADFYVGIDPASMEYLGSIAWDGGEIGNVGEATGESDYRARLVAFFAKRDDASLPERNGWPWPWEDSRTTDCAYTWHNGQVMSAHGRPERWLPYPPKYSDDEDEDNPVGYAEAIPAAFPNMKAIQRVALGGGRSGLIVLEARPDGRIAIVEDEKP